VQVDKAFWRRVYALNDTPIQQKYQAFEGVRMVDLLGWDTTFIGMNLTQRQEAHGTPVFELRFGQEDVGYMQERTTVWRST
jgi:hypothetical protein